MLAAIAILAGGAGADGSHTYEIEMFNAFGIVEGSDVRVAGVNVGTVTGLTINADKRAVVSVDLSGELAVLGEDTTCSSEPQSLIAEYFIDCEPKGEPLDDGEMIPAEQVQQTVQADLVQNTVREPYMTRFALILNEFGTALAGNPETLNEAIRLGAPALTEFERALAILDDQRNMIRDLNVDSNKIMADLADQRDEVVRFIEEAGETAEISTSRREDLSGQFAVLDDFLAELDPTLASLEELAVEQTPLLEDLGAAAPALNTLALELPPFNRASEPAFETLGEASVVGKRAMESGRKPIRLLAKAGKRAPAATEMLADLLRDLDDPRRAVEIDDRAGRSTGRTGTEPGTKDTMGYTGLEGLLNYVYYQTLASNQFDQSGHLLNFGLYGVNTGPCGSFSTGRDAEGNPGVPAQGGGTTTDILEAEKCVAWLGPNQPGISEDLNLEPYDPSVCENGVAAGAEELCTPPSSARSGSQSRRSALDELLEKQLDAIRPGLGSAPSGPATPAPVPDAGSGSGKNAIPSPGAGPGGNAPLPGLDLLDFLMGS